MRRHTTGGLASDERQALRRAKFRTTYGCPALPESYLGQAGVMPPRDRLAERAAWRARNAGPVLGIGSPFRVYACWRLLGRLPTLPGDCKHGYPKRHCPHCEVTR